MITHFGNPVAASWLHAGAGLLLFLAALAQKWFLVRGLPGRTVETATPIAAGRNCLQWKPSPQPPATG